MTFIYYYNYPIGRLGIVEKEDEIIAISFADEFNNSDFFIKETPLIQKTHKQLTQYFNGERQQFDLPLAPQGTPFQKKVWQALQTIPYGETWTYKQLAEAIGNEKASRAVGNANNKNPIIIVIPCHRVIGSNGKLVGYRGGITTKKQLLELEDEYR